MPEENKPLVQIFHEEVVDIRAKFQEERSRWYGDEINWDEMEKTAEKLSLQFREVKNRYEGRINWLELGEEERHIPSAISSLDLELAMYVGPRNLKGEFDGE